MPGENPGHEQRLAPRHGCERSDDSDDIDQDIRLDQGLAAPSMASGVLAHQEWGALTIGDDQSQGHDEKQDCISHDARSFLVSSERSPTQSTACARQQQFEVHSTIARGASAAPKFLGCRQSSSPCSRLASKSTETDHNSSDAAIPSSDHLANEGFTDTEST